MSVYVLLSDSDLDNFLLSATGAIYYISFIYSTVFTINQKVGLIKNCHEYLSMKSQISCQFKTK